MYRGQSSGRGMAQFAARLGGGLAGDADVGQPVRTVRRDFPVDHAVAFIQVGQRSAKRSVVRQDEQAGMVVAQAQFASGAKHAVGFDAAQFRLFDFEIAEIRADGRAGDALSGVAIRCAADDLQRFATADVHFADAHVVRIRMRFAGENLRHDDAFRNRARLFDAFDFQSRACQTRRQFLGVPWDVNVILQPLQ